MGYEIIPGNIAVTNTRMTSKNLRERTLEQNSHLSKFEWHRREEEHAFHSRLLEVSRYSGFNLYCFIYMK